MSNLNELLFTPINYNLFKSDKEIEQAQTKKFFQEVDHETLFRFGYVPFVIAELAWDYADTIITTASTLRLDFSKATCRRIRQLRIEYLRYRDVFIDSYFHDIEIENMYVFEDGVAHINKLLLIACDCEIHKDNFPRKYSDYFKAVSQCEVILKGLLIYVNKQTRKIEKQVGHRIDKVLQPQMYELFSIFDNLKLSVSSDFQVKVDDFAKTIANQIGLIVFDDETLNFG